MFWFIFLGISCFLGVTGAVENACAKIECLKGAKLQCEAVGKIVIQKEGFCACCNLEIEDGERGTCDEAYCNFQKWPVITKKDCDPRYEVFEKKDVEECRCYDRCEPIWEKTPCGKECGKALCAFWNCGIAPPPKVCPKGEVLVPKTACNCCAHCKKITKKTKKDE